MNIKVNKTALTIHSEKDQPSVLERFGKASRQSKEAMEEQLGAVKHNFIQNLHSAGFGNYENSVKQIAEFLTSNGTLTVRAQPEEPSTVLEIVLTGAQKPFGFLEALKVETEYVN